MCVTVDQARQQSCATHIDRFNVAGRVSLHLRSRSDFLDLTVFNQHGGGRNDPAGPGIDQSTSFYESIRSGYLRRDLPGNKEEDCQN